MPKIKTKKCALKSCRKEFSPKPYWQKYHSKRCAWTAVNQKNMALLRLAKKIRKAEERGVA